MRLSLLIKNQSALLECGKSPGKKKRRVIKMNYRHGFHAGNHADALKHAALALILAKLVAKPKPMAVIDAFGGAGRYDLLLDDEPGRTNEWREGIERVWANRASAGPALQPWLEAVAVENPDGELRFYPGSPAIVQSMLRRDDKLLVVEKHPEEAERLRESLGPDSCIRVYEQDAWEALRSFLPPTPRRGLVIVDPPFEQPGEYDRMVRALSDGLKRWANGVFLFWHAAKDRREVARYLREVRIAVGETPCLAAELAVARDDAPGLGASGIVLVNPPYGVPEALDQAGNTLAALLSGPGVAQPWRMDWLTPPK